MINKPGIRGLASIVAACMIACMATSASRGFEIVMMQNDLIQFTEQSFIQNVFGNLRTYAAARKHVEEGLQNQIDFVETAVTLSPEQRNKLELAGQADIHRFFNEYERVKRGITFGGIPRDEWQGVWQKTQPLQTKFTAGLYGSSSLFHKTIASALEPEQREQFDALKREHDLAVYADQIRMTLAIMDRKVPLTRQQRESLIDMLLSNTTPPRFYGQTTMHYYVVLARMASLPSEDVEALFNDNEWKVVSALLAQGKAMQRTIQLQEEALK